ncbi:MAG: TonB-dependent receptor [Geobacteraceae bacterium]|nr:TonB-dependent receptor [Geobacteraceae bacterium]NTW80573.1 TonB-dependent receptor [Geobacteraceae bacterium]
MKTVYKSHSLQAILLFICLTICLSPSLSWGEENEDTLDLFNAFQEQTSASSRVPKPLSQTAENVTVITAVDIRLLNAHTLADVLITIPGIQTDPRGAQGNIVFTSIQSSSVAHVLVLLDGIPLNTLGENFSDVSLVPAQIIERIEIVKGAASSVWGQALGGVINVITKSSGTDRADGGSVSASIGERTTADTRAELFGTTGRMGYYLSGGFLGTNGLTPHTAVSSNGIYTKLLWSLPDNGQFWSTFKYDRADRGTLWGDNIGWDNKEDQSLHTISASMGMRKSLANGLELELLGRYSSRHQDTFSAQISDNTPTQTINSRELASGASAKLVWRGVDNLLVVGADYEHAELKANDAFVHVDMLDRTVNRWGVYLNDTSTFGPVSVIPGARFDRTVTGGDQFSPSLGAVWQLTDATLVRGYTARGFSLPSLLNDRQPEKVWTSQIGIESSTVPYLWVKGTLFRNELTNVRNLRNLDSSIPESRVAKGAELEVRTTPLYNTSVGAGYTFTDSIHASDGSKVYADPRHTVQLALRYDDKTYRGALTGRHIYWNAVPGYGGQYAGLIWDLHLGATLIKRENNSFELFFSGHNLFNGKQYQDEIAPNASRWFEGGVRVNF